MQKLLLALFLGALVAPLTALAQQGPPPGYAPTPEMRAKMEQFHSAAKTATFNTLSPDHQARVQSVVNQFNSGALTADTATSQINAILTPVESSAVLAQARKTHEAMRQAFANGSMSAAPPGGWHHAHEGDGAMHKQHRAPSAGHVLLMLSASRERMR